MNKKRIIFILKYLFSFLVAATACIKYYDKRLLFCCTVELFIIIVTTNILSKYKFIGYIWNCILLLLYNIQYMVLFFSGTFVSLVMVTNLDSLEDLSGNFVIYGTACITLIIISFLPISHIPLKEILLYKLLSISLVIELLFSLLFGNTYSALFRYAVLVKEEKIILEKKNKILNSEDCTNNFYKSEVPGQFKSSFNKRKKPNVVLIFTEGLSQNIIDDERQIMPNIASYQKESISFSNYYNYTFATYRGLSGQLYSGYQLENFDENNLISIQDILRKENYSTTFINTEPQNIQFTNYLQSMDFDTIIENAQKKYNGPADSLSDKEAYDLLFETMETKHSNNKPFFISIYTFGTHASFDSPDEKFSDGTDKLLNKFYNADYHFGSFMDKFKNSSLYNDTIIIFTTDHATYAENEYISAFPNYNRSNPGLDRIPFFIYHKDVIPNTIDVSGRNSLDLVPTILDYLDISHENYFLGTSLYYPKDNSNNYDTVYVSGVEIMSSRDGNITPLSDSELNIVNYGLDKYYTAKYQGAK